MDPTAGPRPRLSDVLYADLVNAISGGDFKPGERLPSEADLSERFGVSRPIVREALKQLREQGLIISRKGSGSYVAGAGLTDGKGRHLGPQEARRISSIADVQRLFQFRLSLEGEIAATAAQLRTEAQMDAIDQAAEALGRKSATGATAIEEDIRFHRAIAAATNNPFFMEAFDRISTDMAVLVELARSLLMTQPLRHIERVQADHTAIATAIRDRNPALARETMQFHINTAQARLFFGDGENGSQVWDMLPPTGNAHP